MQEYIITAEAIHGTAVGYLCLGYEGSQSFSGGANIATRFTIGDGWLHLHRLRKSGDGNYVYKLQPQPIT